MAPLDGDDLAEWRSRLATALMASFQAMDARAPAAEILMRQARVRTIEEEGRWRGFRPGTDPAPRRGAPAPDAAK